MGNIKNKLATQDTRKIIYAQVEDYKATDRIGRGRILDNLESVTHRPRKSIIRTINRRIATLSRLPHAGRPPAYTKVELLPPKETRGRKRKYTKEVEAALAEIMETHNYICAERLYPCIKSTINILKRDHEWHYSQQTTTLLEQMPFGTLKAYVVKLTKDKGLMRGFSTTRSSDLLNAIPIFHGDWSTKPLGYGQVDTVVHSGPRLEGCMAYTVSFVEMQTYWQEYVAQPGKHANTTKRSISVIAKQLPFVLTGIHSDSGDEFVNGVLLAWCRQRHLEFTRSRPHEKNDNCNVEERNGHVVRHYVGYERYDCQEAIDAMNELYSVLRLYGNYFQPVMRIKQKTRLPNGKCIRKYKPAKTPYELVLEHPDVSIATKLKLTAEYNSLNPKHLRDKIKALTVNLERIQREQGYHFNSETSKNN